MSRLITEPWDAQDLLLMPVGFSGNSFPTSPVVDYPAAFQATDTYRGFVSSPALNVSFDGFYIYINNNLGPTLTVPFYALVNSSTIQVHLVRDDLTGLLNLFKGGTFSGSFINTTGRVLLGTGIHPLAQGSHYHLQIGYDSSGNVTVKVDGVDDIVATSVAGLGSYFQTEFRSIQISGTQQYYFDSYYKNDNNGAEDNTYGGVVKMITKVPIADGFYTAWQKNPNSGTQFSKINETPNDGDTTTIFSDVNNDRSSFNPDTHGLTETSQVIKAVSTRWVVRKVSDGQVKPFFRISGTDYPASSASDVGTDYGAVMDRRTKNPATSAAWALTDTFEVGIQAILP